MQNFETTTDATETTQPTTVETVTAAQPDQTQGVDAPAVNAGAPNPAVDDNATGASQADHGPASPGTDTGSDTGSAGYAAIPPGRPTPGNEVEQHYRSRRLIECRVRTLALLGEQDIRSHKKIELMPRIIDALSSPTARLDVHARTDLLEAATKVLGDMDAAVTHLDKFEAFVMDGTAVDLNA